MTLATDVFTSPARIIGSSGLSYPPTTSTVVTGERDVVLIDTRFLEGEIAAWAIWSRATRGAVA